MFSHFVRKPSLVGGCLSQVDVDRINEIASNKNHEGDPEIAFLQKQLKMIYNLRLRSNDSLRTTVYDRRIQELIWKRYTENKKIVNNKTLEELQKSNPRRAGEVNLTYCQNSNIIHNPENYPNPLSDICMNLSEHCFREEKEEQANYEHINLRATTGIYSPVHKTMGTASAFRALGHERSERTSPLFSIRSSPIKGEPKSAFLIRSSPILGKKI